MKELTESQRMSATLKIMAAVDEWGLSGDQQQPLTKISR